MTTPKPTPPKPAVQNIDKNIEVPDPTPLKSQEMEVPKLKIVPQPTELKTETPAPSEEKEMPSPVPEKDCVTIVDQKIQIKPTKLRYFRNKAASGYGLIKAIPLTELFTYEKGVLDKDRDADQLMFDFLVSAFDDVDFVEKNYDEFDAENIDQIVKIFGRLNHIDEKEEAARKNREAQAKR